MTHTNQSHEGTPRMVTCPVCGTRFTCGMSANCWCATKVVPDEVRRYLAERYETCVCSACLDRLIGEAEGKDVVQNQEHKGRREVDRKNL